MIRKMALKPQKADWLVYGLTILVLVSVVIAMVSFSLGNAKQVTIHYNNELIYTMYLDQNEEYLMQQNQFELLLGDLIVEVKDSKVRVKQETSPHNYCSQMGWVSLKGTSIICAPNYVVVTIQGYYDSGFDIIPGGGVG